MRKIIICFFSQGGDFGL
uniref:Uncharacterized protein n=1 Tax=Rhizophora mucronata TaxID=61149 RepID=A0A2P2Q3N8_RHIMU